MTVEYPEGGRIIKMRLEPTPIPGVRLVHVEEAKDERGLFSELFSFRDAIDLAKVETGRSTDYFDRLRQVNLCSSRKAGTVRGLHWQDPPFGQTKIVFCLQGEIWDVAVDFRSARPKYFGARLSPSPLTGLYIHESFAHGYQTLKDNAQVLYMIFGSGWKKDAERGVRFNDPKIDVRWPLDPTIVSERDRSWPLL